MVEIGTKIGDMERVDNGWLVSSVYPFTTFTTEQLSVLKNGDAIFHRGCSTPDAHVYRCANCDKLLWKMGMVVVLVPVFCCTNCEDDYNKSIDTEVDRDYDLLKFSFERLKGSTELADVEYMLKTLRNYCEKYDLDYRTYVEQIKEWASRT